MRITPQWTEADIKKDMERLAEAAFKVTLSEISRVGMEIVSAARNKEPMEEYREAINALSNAKGIARAVIMEDTPGFNDQTGNLRGSIGYFVFYEGKEVAQNFTGTQAGQSKGRQYAKSIGETYFDGWALVIVAGMEYASWVEALGYDVITGSTLDGPTKMREATKNIEAVFK